MSRLMLVDAVALQEWEHEEPLDGKADYVFWGLEAPNAAAALGVPG